MAEVIHVKDVASNANAPMGRGLKLVSGYATGGTGDTIDTGLDSIVAINVTGSVGDIAVSGISGGVATVTCTGASGIHFYWTAIGYVE